MNRTLTFRMSRTQALRADLLVCRCGHRPNNHFEHDKKPCAHCQCKSYDERASIGRLVGDEE